MKFINNLPINNLDPSSPLSATALQNASAANQPPAAPNQPDYDAEEEQEEQRLLCASVTALDRKLHRSNGHTRIGKIARLPFEVREMVNNMIRGGMRYIDIVVGLKQHGYTHINENNISFWKSGGYLDWLDH